MASKYTAHGLAAAGITAVDLACEVERLTAALADMEARALAAEAETKRLRAALNPQAATAAHAGRGEITISPKRMGGTPCIAGTRIPVDAVVAVHGGDGEEGVKRALYFYPNLTRADVEVALWWASMTQAYSEHDEDED